LSTKANSLQAKENPCFGMYNAWTELGANGTPKEFHLGWLEMAQEDHDCLPM
jgi:hypothetical protein